jgi:hypothetical protein
MKVLKNQPRQLKLINKNIVKNYTGTIILSVY